MVPWRDGDTVSFNDRLREASRWVNAHPGDTIVVTFPRVELAELLAEAADDPGRWPWQLSGWVRDTAHRATREMCWTCLDASEVEWDEDWHHKPQPNHDDCEGFTCACPHHAHSVALDSNAVVVRLETARDAYWAGPDRVDAYNEAIEIVKAMIHAPE